MTWCRLDMRRRSIRAGTFDLGRFFQSADRSRRIVAYNASQVIFAQGEACTSVLYIQNRRRQAVAAVAIRQKGGSGDARPRGFLR
jgi:hypothetical protein